MERWARVWDKAAALIGSLKTLTQAEKDFTIVYANQLMNRMEKDRTL